MTHNPAKALMISAPHSGSGKSLVTMGLAHAFMQSGKRVRVLKSGPDYIDAGHHKRVTGQACFNLDAWAMTNNQATAILHQASQDADIILVEGAMGLFDGAIGQQGSSAQLAKMLDIPVLLVMNVGAMAQSIGAQALGFLSFDDGLDIAGCVLNRVGSARHLTLLNEGLAKTGIKCFGALGADKNLKVPSRHLGLLQAEEISDFDTLVANAGELITEAFDLAQIERAATPLPVSTTPDGALSALPPLGQHMAIARDAAFSFTYAHHLTHWRAQGAHLSFFSPLKNEAPDPRANAVLLPGGYPELHAPELAANKAWQTGLSQLARSGALIYGECGGYMALGEALIDADGIAHQMAGLLPVVTDFSTRQRHLGYRQLHHDSALPWPNKLKAHEFHYSTLQKNEGTSLFQAHDLSGSPAVEMGCQMGRVMGSYAHVIEPGSGSQHG